MASQDTTTGLLANENTTHILDAATIGQGTTGILLRPDDGLQEMSMDDQHTGTTRPSHSAAGAQPRDNFPLPRELRDQ